VRLRVEAVEAGAEAAPPCFAGLPASAVAAAVELGRFRYRYCCAAAAATKGGIVAAGNSFAAAAAGAAAAAAAPYSTAAAAAADVGDAFLTSAIVESERDFRLLADGKLNKVTAEAFLRRYLPSAEAASARGRAEAWEDLALCFFLCDLDDDGHLDGVEYAAARWLLAFFGAKGRRVSGKFGARPVLPHSLVHVTKRAMATKRELSIKRVRSVFICSRAGDDVADAMRAKLSRILLDRKYALCAGAAGGAFPPRHQAVVVAMTPHCLDKCVDLEGDAMFRELRDATRNEAMVIVPVFHPAYWAQAEAQHRLLRMGGASDLEEIMTKVRVQKGAELDDAHLGALAKILHNLLQGRDLSMEED